MEKFPLALFSITKTENNEGKYNRKITGNLTIKEKTKEIEFLANVIISNSNVKILSETFIINRGDWDLTYHNSESKGIPMNYLISNDIEFTIKVTEIIKQKKIL